MEAGSEAIEGYVTENGNLTCQDVVTPKYRESEWKDIPVFIPYAFFPSVTEEANGFVVAEAGIEGQPFTRYGGRNYFTLNP